MWCGVCGMVVWCVVLVWSQLVKMIDWRGVQFAFAVSAEWSDPSTLVLTIVDATLGWATQLLTVLEIHFQLRSR